MVSSVLLVRFLSAGRQACLFLCSHFYEAFRSRLLRRSFKHSTRRLSARCSFRARLGAARLPVRASTVGSSAAHSRDVLDG
jgi:hypothetical protein